MAKGSRSRPWHEVVRLKEELRTGELALAEFAADLHEVTLAQGRRPVYEDPAKFFALTYPTHALRELVKEIAGRLAGRSDKAVRQLELTYGGGKTHTLIALYHLFREPAALPEVAAVREFREHVGADLPPAVTVTLCFDKIDAERGIEGVRAPDGERRTLRHPWSVLAFQLAGADGLRAIHGAGGDAERATPPAEPLLVKLLELPQQHGRATLILIDEVLMYAREKAGLDPVWRERIVDFFQYLTQAVAKVDRAALVASLLATDPNRQRGELAQQLIAELFDVFRRQREEGVQPVQRGDVAEVLRRRFFAPGELGDRNAFRSHVIGVVRGLAKLDETTARARAAAEERFIDSFPFHPDLTDVFYSRWTQLDGFQRTRGILRILATALRAAERWDRSPLIGVGALLAAPGAQTVSEAVRELAGVATSEQVEGSKTDWVPLLEAELAKARQIQEEVPALREGREAEQAVLAVFLHSQPVGHKASTPDLLRMAGSAAPDAIEIDKGLRRWRELSWFLDDEDLGAEDPRTAAALPKSWRLGNRPNLRQMHDEACRQRVTAEAEAARLEQAVRETRALVEGAKAAGASVHRLPAAPREVGDDGAFRYVLLGADAASESGKPSSAARRFLTEVSGPHQPRVHRNAVVLAVPSRTGLQAARSCVRALLGWEEVERELAGHRVDPVPRELLHRRLQEARRLVPDMVRQAYQVVVTVNDDNEVHAFRLTPSAGPLFAAIKNDKRARITETALDAEALLPDGPYDLWREDEDARLVKDLAGAFSRQSRLPKVLDPRVLFDTVLQGVERGLLLARLARPDGSVRTWWRAAVDPDAQTDPGLEVALPERAELLDLPPALLAPGALPALWPEERGAAPQLTLRALAAYFAGGHTVQVRQQGYACDDTLSIPRCSAETVRSAAARAVEQGRVWLTNGPTSVWNEPVPYGALDEAAVLHPPPALIPAQELTAHALPEEWRGGSVNGVALTRALSQARRTALPWGLVRDSIKAGVESRWLQLAAASGALNCGYDQAGSVLLERPAEYDPQPPAVPSGASGAVTLDAGQIQDLAVLLPRLLEESAGYALRFKMNVELDSDSPPEVRAALDRLLAEVSGTLKTAL